MKNDFKEALRNILNYAVDILFTIPAMALYRVFSAPIKWIANLFLKSNDESVEAVETKESFTSENDIKHIKITEPVKKVHYKETFASKNHFFNFEVETSFNTEEDEQNMPKP